MPATAASAYAGELGVLSAETETVIAGELGAAKPVGEMQLHHLDRKLMQLKSARRRRVGT
jgi:hypothetical protein